MPGRMEFRTAYWDQPEHRTAFIRFLKEIHHLDLSRWYTSGFWDPNYNPFSFFHEGQVLSNVCAYSIPCLILGEKTRIGQLSGVGTHPRFRGQGLNRELTDRALAWLRDQHRAIYLFSDDDAVGYYRKYGFTGISEYSAFTTVPSGMTPAVASAEKIHLSDLDFIHQKVRERQPISHIFSSLSTQLTMFHILYSLYDCLHYIPNLDTIIASRKSGDVLRIYDIIAPEIPTLAQLLPYLSLENVTLLEFRFSPDRLQIPTIDHRELIGNNPFHMGSPIPANPLIIPYTFNA